MPAGVVEARIKGRPYARISPSASPSPGSALAATGADGAVWVFAGCYFTREIQPAIQEPPFRPLFIERARLRPAEGPLDAAVPAGCDP